MNRIVACGFVACLLLLSAVSGEGATVYRDVLYRTTSADPKNTLDVHVPEGERGGRRPVLLYFHGGLWKRGVKDGSTAMILGRWALSKGWIFVSAAYRLTPSSWRDRRLDAQDAIRWVHLNIAREGGDPNRIVLAGFSAGAQVAAYAAVDMDGLTGRGVPPGVVRAALLLDGCCYDVGDCIARNRGRKYEQPFRSAFGNNPRDWELASATYKAAAHVKHAARLSRGAAPVFPHILLVHAESDVQESRVFAGVLQNIGAKVLVLDTPWRKHAGALRQFGAKGDPVRPLVDRFLHDAL